MREKLFDLMMRDPCPSPVTCNSNCKYYKSHHCHAERYADHLIANGVTFATDNIVGYKWIPVTERLPENIGLFLVIEKHWIDGSPCRRIAKWNTEDWFTADRKSKEITPRVTHWMPLPQPPKGE